MNLLKEKDLELIRENNYDEEFIYEVMHKNIETIQENDIKNLLEKNQEKIMNVLANYIKESKELLTLGEDYGQFRNQVVNAIYFSEELAVLLTESVEEEVKKEIEIFKGSGDNE